MRSLALLTVSALTMSAVAADPPKPSESKATAKAVVEKVGAAMLKGDYSPSFETTYEPALKAMGGREAAEDSAKELLKMMEAKGVRMKSYTVGEPGDLYTEGGNTFVVIPTVLEMTAPDAKIVVRGYSLGISTDAGKTWKFVDGQGLRDEEERKKILPKLPAKLDLPKYQRPEVTKVK